MANNADISHRQHPLLYVGFKCMRSVFFAHDIKQWISTSFGMGAAQQLTGVIDQMQANRERLRVMSEANKDTFSHEAFNKGWLPAAAAYFNDMEALILKTQGTRFEGGIPNMVFIWTHWLNNSEIRTNLLRVELWGVLFNIAAAFSLMGAVLPSDMRDQVKMLANGVVQDSTDVVLYRCRMFRTSAILFDNLAQRLKNCSYGSGTLPAQEDLDDISLEVAEMFRDVMLAQAQECYYQAYKQKYPMQSQEHSCAELGLGASQYYLEFLKRYETAADAQHRRTDDASQNDEADEPDSIPLFDHIPQYWYVHCETARSLVRTAICVHYQRSLEDKLKEHGTRVAFMQKAVAIIEERQRELAVVSPDDNAILGTKRAELSAVLNKLELENQKVYFETVPSQETINQVKMRAQSRVTIEKVSVETFENEYLKVFFRAPADPFAGIILSLGSGNAWLKFRKERIEAYSRHLAEMRPFDEHLFEMFERHPDCLLTYFVSHRLKSAPSSFFQTPLGDCTLLFKKMPTYSGILQLIDITLPKSTAAASVLMSALEQSVEQLRQFQRRELVDQRYSILRIEHQFCTGHSLSDVFSRVRELYNGYLRSADVEKQLPDKLFGAFKLHLFDASVSKPKQTAPPVLAHVTPSTPPPAAAAASASTSTSAQNGTWFSGVWSAPTASAPTPPVVVAPAPPVPAPILPPPPPANAAVQMGDLLVSLIDQHFLVREQLEDQLASELLLSIERKETELSQLQLSEPDRWVDSQLEPMLQVLCKIVDHAKAEQNILTELMQLYSTHSEHVATLALEALRSTSGADVAAVSYDSSLLAGFIHGLFKFRYCKRFAPLFQCMEERITMEGTAVNNQCSDILLSARNSALTRPLQRSSLSSSSAGNLDNYHL